MHIAVGIFNMSKTSDVYVYALVVCASNRVNLLLRLTPALTPDIIIIIIIIILSSSSFMRDCVITITSDKLIHIKIKITLLLNQLLILSKFLCK
jgi:hypothetical protein